MLHFFPMVTELLKLIHIIYDEHSVVVSDVLMFSFVC